MTTTATARHMLAINPAHITDRTLRHIASSGASITANPATLRAITRAAASPFGPRDTPFLARILGVRVTADNTIPDNIIQIA